MNPKYRVGKRGVCLAFKSPLKPVGAHLIQRKGKELDRTMESLLKGFRQRTEKMI